MSLDTHSKRLSMLGFGRVWITHVDPDVTISEGMRQTFLSLPEDPALAAPAVSPAYVRLSLGAVTHVQLSVGLRTHIRLNTKITG